MINLFVFNLKQFREGIISSNENGITLKLSFSDIDGSLYEYVFTKDTYSEKYLDMICYLLNNLYNEMGAGCSNSVLNFNEHNSRLYVQGGYIFDKVNIIRRSKTEYTIVSRIEYKLS